jgi:hemoglobin-like flavoprotein
LFAPYTAFYPVVLWVDYLQSLLYSYFIKSSQEMGGGASLCAGLDVGSGKSLDESKHARTTITFLSRNAQVEQAQFLMAYNAEFRVDRALVRICENTWQKIASSTKMAPGTQTIGLFAFCDCFFMHMMSLDDEDVVIPKFQPRSISSLPSRNALLLKIVRYMLSVPNDKFSSKSKIRRLGRAHATRNIRELHFKCFAEAFMRTLVSMGGRSLRSDAKRSWATLLGFFVTELSFENVSFASHNSSHNSADGLAFSEEDETFPQSTKSGSGVLRFRSDQGPFQRNASEGGEIVGTPFSKETSLRRINSRNSSDGADAYDASNSSNNNANGNLNRNWSAQDVHPLEEYDDEDTSEHGSNERDDLYVNKYSGRLEEIERGVYSDGATNANNQIFKQKPSSEKFVEPGVGAGTLIYVRDG